MVAITSFFIDQKPEFQKSQTKIEIFAYQITNIFPWLCY